MLLYCSAYYVVSNRFFKKRMWTFFSFFLISFHTMCVPSLHQIWPPAPSLHWITMHFWKKKKVNKRTITISLSFLAGLYWMVTESVMVIQMSCFLFFFTDSTHGSSTYTQGANDFVFQPCNSNFGLFFFFTFSYQMNFFSAGAKSFGWINSEHKWRLVHEKKAVSEKLTFWMYEAVNSFFLFF